MASACIPCTDPCKARMAVICYLATCITGSYAAFVSVKSDAKIYCASSPRLLVVQAAEKIGITDDEPGARPVGGMQGGAFNTPYPSGVLNPPAGSRGRCPSSAVVVVVLLPVPLGAL